MWAAGSYHLHNYYFYLNLEFMKSSFGFEAMLWAQIASIAPGLSLFQRLFRTISPLSRFVWDAGCYTHCRTCMFFSIDEFTGSSFWFNVAPVDYASSIALCPSCVPSHPFFVSHSLLEFTTFAMFACFCCTKNWRDLFSVSKPYFLILLHAQRFSNRSDIVSNLDHGMRSRRLETDRVLKDNRLNCHKLHWVQFLPSCE